MISFTGIDIEFVLLFKNIYNWYYLEQIMDNFETNYFYLVSIMALVAIIDNIYFLALNHL